MLQILRQGTHGFTSLPKEGMLRIFPPLKTPTASAGFERTLTPRPPKPLSCVLEFGLSIVPYSFEWVIVLCLDIIIRRGADKSLAQPTS
jgi:hypothetical protein